MFCLFFSHAAHNIHHFNHNVLNVIFSFRGIIIISKKYQNSCTLPCHISIQMDQKNTPLKIVETFESSMKTWKVVSYFSSNLFSLYSRPTVTGGTVTRYLQNHTDVVYIQGFPNLILGNVIRKVYSNSPSKWPCLKHIKHIMHECKLILFPLCKHKNISLV